jgi:hypothetical protein
MKCKHFERRQVKPETRQEEMLQLWRDVAVATAGSDNCTKETSPAKFAAAVMGAYAELIVALDAKVKA